MNTLAERVQAHYARDGFTETLLEALRQAGKDLDALTREDLAPFEEFHIRGRDATRELAQLAGLHAGMRVLDVGSGVGGPARTLAAEFGCTVDGVDLVEAFCEAARTLTRRVGLDGRVAFRQGDALALPYDAQTYDAVVLEHVNMNIDDKSRLFREAARVVRPRGTLALYEICAGPQQPPHFPVPWASDASASALAAPDVLQREAVAAGFVCRVWQDVTDVSRAWFREMVAGMAARTAARPEDNPTPPGLNLLMGPDTLPKVQNLLRNLDEGRCLVVRGVFERSEKRDGR